jgi:hypothetical protein
MQKYLIGYRNFTEKNLEGIDFNNPIRFLSYNGIVIKINIRFDYYYFFKAATNNSVIE